MSGPRAPQISKDSARRRPEVTHRTALHYRAAGPCRTARQRVNHARLGRYPFPRSRRVDASVWTPPGPPSEAQVIDSQVRDMGAAQLLERYHDLVDRRLEGSISVKESFELSRIEARLNVDEQDDVNRAAAFRNNWNRERETLLASVEHMLAPLRASL